jgi:ribonuclease E
VIDFIDMESRKNNTAVERRMKESLKNDRARIQIGNISHFGLMELSRQRLRPSLAEASLISCPHCAGLGHIRSPENAALHILRAIEDEGGKFRAAEIIVFLPPEIALYLFNHKRDRLGAIEARYAMRVVFSADPSMLASNFRIEKVKAQTAVTPPAPASYMTPERVAAPVSAPVVEDELEAEDESEDGADADAPKATDTAEEGERKRRRRRRRGKRRADSNGESAPVRTEDEIPAAALPGAEQPAIAPAEPAMQSEIDLVLEASLAEPPEASLPEDGAAPPAKRRRARGPRRRPAAAEDGAETPAEPVFADVADIFEAAERAEAAMEPVLESAPEPLPEPEYAVAAAVEAEPVAPAPTGPAVRPTVIDADAPVAEKKRGWWRR